LSLKIGSKAPDFILKNTEGKDISLSDFKGNKNVVLLFFPLAFTSTCTEELCSTRDNMKIYASLNAEILAISVDSFFTLKEFRKAQNLNFQLLSDFNREVSNAYGSIYKDFYGMKGVSKRSVFVINKDGIITHSEVLENAGMIPDFTKVRDALSENRV
jgi:peroxiredoxin